MKRTEKRGHEEHCTENAADFADNGQFAKALERLKIRKHQGAIPDNRAEAAHQHRAGRASNRRRHIPIENLKIVATMASKTNNR